MPKPQTSKQSGKQARRRNPGEGTLRYREDRDQWEAGITIGELKSGNPKRIRKMFDSKTEAQLWLIDQQSAKQRGQITNAGNSTLGEFITDWLENKRVTRSPRTFTNYAYVLNRLVMPYLGETRLNELAPLHIRRWIGQLSKEGKTTQHLISRAHHTLKMVLNEAVRLEAVGRNVAHSVKVSKPRRRELTRWTAEEAARVLEYGKNSDHRLRHYVHLGLTTGMRREELLGVRWQDINLERAELHVAQCVTYINGKPYFGPPKTPGSQRTIYLDPGTLEALKQQREQVGQIRAAQAHIWQEHDLVFPSLVGTPYNEGRLNEQFHALCHKAGVTRIRVYDLRSTWASVALEAGVHQKLVSERLGHTNVAFTLQVYVRTDEQQRRGAALSTQQLYGAEPETPVQTPAVDSRMLEQPIEIKADDLEAGDERSAAD